MKKRLFALAMAMLMLLSLSACGGDSGGKGAAAVDTNTVAVGAVVIARDDVSDTDVYNFLYGVFENMDTLGHDKAKELNLEFASSVTAVPYHPGAAKYFTEKGLTVPTK